MNGVILRSNLSLVPFFLSYNVTEESQKNQDRHFKPSVLSSFCSLSLNFSTSSHLKPMYIETEFFYVVYSQVIGLGLRERKTRGEVDKILKTFYFFFDKNEWRVMNDIDRLFQLSK